LPHREIIAPQKQRFRLTARLPTRCKFAKPHVLTNPFKITAQRLCQLGERPCYSCSGIETDELQPSQLFRDFGIRHRF